ncbi:DNA-directed DNA polymerase B [Caballeronia peredens]|nr:DNA-directed DNA polymerase B [Caballeronia peredens]
MAQAPQFSPAAIAVNRFGLGARPGEPLPDDPRGWLAAQADPQRSLYRPLPAALSGQPSSAALAAQFAERQRAIRDASDADKPAVRKQYAEQIRDVYRSAVDARVTSALTAPAPFIERLVHFWANHFAVSIEKPPVAMLAGSFENEAIRPHVLGRFEDMLVAAERHPAMQIFLDQPRSVGPDSPAAERAAMRDPGARRGLNENLAREIMELHTLGVRSGYTQADVTEFARALTGWSLGAMTASAASTPNNSNDPALPGQFVFRPRLHEPGVRTVMGRQYAQANEAQPLAVLHDLATARATAHHVAEKLARHFVADTPPPVLVDRLADVFSDTGGDLPSVYRALVDAPDAWPASPAKFKTPWDWTLSALRGLGRTDLQGVRAAPLLTQLGQQIWRPGSPAGYDDVAASWAAPDALVRRVELAQRFAARMGDTLDARALGPQLLAGSLSDATASAVARAESAPTALALLLVSPDFLRR